MMIIFPDTKSVHEGKTDKGPVLLMQAPKAVIFGAEPTMEHGKFYAIVQEVSRRHREELAARPKS